MIKIKFQQYLVKTHNLNVKQIQPSYFLNQRMSQDDHVQ